MRRSRSALFCVLLSAAAVLMPSFSAAQRTGRSSQGLSVAREVFVTNTGNVPINYQWRSTYNGEWRSLTLEPGSERRHFCDRCESDHFFFQVRTTGQPQPRRFTLAVGTRNEFYFDADQRQWLIRKSSGSSNR